MRLVPATVLKLTSLFALKFFIPIPLCFLKIERFVVSLNSPFNLRSLRFNIQIVQMDSDIDKQSKSQVIFQENATSLMEQLAKAKMDYNSLAENISQGLARCQIICDANGVPKDYRILSANTAYEKHTGINRHIAIGKTILEIYPDIEKSWIDTYGRVALTQKTEIITGYNHNTKRYYRSVAYSDTPGEFMMLFEDTTHQNELEKAYELVSKSMKVSNDLLSNMPEGYKRGEVICDGNNTPIDFRILEVNEAYQKQTGINLDNFIGKTMLEVFPNVEKTWIETIGKVALSGEATHFVDYNHNTNKYFEISVFSPKHGEFALFIKDVTSRENARIKLEEAYRKVEESEQLKSAFLANMSHEIRTPLNAVLGFAELLEEKELDKQEEQKCLENIKSSGHRLLTIVSDILDISKLEANQQKLNFTTNNLNQIIKRLHEQFKVINSNPALEISCFKALEDNNATIKTDATRLEQILSNLLENALKHTKEGFIRFGYLLKGDFLEFFVQDSGAGIKKEDRETIFKRFGQATNKTEINQGTGLGIPIAEGFTQLFGGKMWLDSELGKGSTFYFAIPYLPNSPDLNQTKKPTILVAEDEEANFLLLQLWLKKYCHLIHANDGHETVALVKENKDIDLVLMDIKMPYLNGIEATKEIRKSNEQIPIIAQTAFIMDDEREEIRSAGCNEIISKPIQREDFKKLLTSYIPHLTFA